MVLRRREILTGGLALAGYTALSPAAPLARATTQLTLHPDRILARMPQDFTGISVEKMQMAEPAYFSAANHGLIALHRRLSPHGILRIGGNSSEFCWWKTKADQPPPVIKTVGQGRADNWMPQNFYAIEPVAVENLRGFLDACGWRCIWGFNFGTATPERNAEEAAFVARVLGERILYFQIGNEPDFYREANNHLRPAGWDFPDYLNEWVANADAISKLVPTARFGGPDVGANVEWTVRFGTEAKRRIGQRLFALSGHYYASGPPDNPAVTAEGLMHSGDAVARRMAMITPAVKAAGVPYRMTEGNSCYRGGKAGMSNALAAALWGADYMLDMAAHGASGVNFHCGSGAAISASLGGKLPGAFTDHDREIAKLGAFYAPIAGNLQAGFDARPLFYGMMLAEQFAGARMFATSLQTSGNNVTAYAGEGPSGWRIALINKEPARDIAVSLNGLATGKPRLWRLSGPSLTATEGITLAGAPVAHQSADWHPQTGEKPVITAGTLRIILPKASAVLILT